MGVPAFFRWLSRKYPSIVVHCVEEKAREINGTKVPVDTTQPNPNMIEFDNLYLDMNGIIHPCCHPEDKPAPKDEDEMMEAIFEYIDRIFAIVRPRKVLYMAIDGVAPRAKMNQQRSRRFRASKETREKVEDMERIRRELTEKGARLPPPKEKTAHFDSNCITPGTEFMANLAVALRYYVTLRMNDDPGWHGIKVILSDANVPGEGEHKIMDYIRHQRSQPDHDPNTHHCLYGADADLIMLGLATHEPNFTILREEFKPGQQQKKPCDLCGQIGHELNECEGLPRDNAGEEAAPPAFVPDKEFVFIRLNVLREYLERTLRIDGLPFPFDFDRALDDWVFLCFFVGNDFLPHLPSLQIREGAIDRLVNIYKDVVPKTRGYLTDAGRVDLKRVQVLMKALGEMEDSIFKQRQEDDKNFRRRQRERKAAEKRRREGYSAFHTAPAFIPGGQFSPVPAGQKPPQMHNIRKDAVFMRSQSLPATPVTVKEKDDNFAIAANLRSQLRAIRDAVTEKQEGTMSGRGTPSTPDMSSRKRKHDDDDDDDAPPDDIRLWEEGWRGRYYGHKFGVDAEKTPTEYNRFRTAVSNAYVQGLCWVLAYYYQGCPSWKWYYPYHYAPFASDFRDIGDLPTNFERGTVPFKPLEQLMGVFPAASGKFLPPSWRELMSSADSPIIDFYPTDFRIDLNGKKYAWQGVALLPFVDEKRLLDALSSVYPGLTADERMRNSLGHDRLFVHKSHQASSFLQACYEDTPDGSDKKFLPVNAKLADGMGGLVCKDQEACVVGGFLASSPSGLKPVTNSQVVCTLYRDPVCDENYVFPACLLPGAVLPSRTLKPEDFARSNSSPGSYRPQIGFVRRDQLPPSPMDATAANRMLRHGIQQLHGSRGGGYSTPSFNRSRSYEQGSWSEPPHRYSPWARGGQGEHPGGSHQQYSSPHAHRSYPPSPQPFSPPRPFAPPSPFTPPSQPFTPSPSHSPHTGPHDPRDPRRHNYNRGSYDHSQDPRRHSFGGRGSGPPSYRHY